MPSPLRQAEERSNNQSAAWPINPASSRNQKPPPLGGGAFTIQLFRDRLAKNCLY
jgi:hypothetical protein